MGIKVALVCDAGTPTVSDPGFKFVQEARKNGVLVEALPGPCAVTTALSASGFPADKFTFMGYLSKTISEREDTLYEIMRSGKTCALYESPARLVRTLHSIKEIFGPRHQVYLAFELTKKHEEHYRDTIERLIEHFEEVTEAQRLKGEITMVLAPFVDAEEEERKDILRGQHFNPARDSIMKINILTMADKLNNEVEMMEAEFRSLLKSLFPDVPSSHINAIIRKVRSKGK